MIPHVTNCVGHIPVRAGLQDGLSDRVRMSVEVFAILIERIQRFIGNAVFIKPLGTATPVCVQDDGIAALQGVAANGKYSITVGEISLTDKTFDEMIKFEEYYRGLAEQDETGTTSIGRVGTIQARF